MLAKETKRHTPSWKIDSDWTTIHKVRQIFLMKSHQSDVYNIGDMWVGSLLG